MTFYKRKVCYYETDKMGITHHSNYVRWMEEARIDFIGKVGYGYDKLEEQGLISPVIGLECKYVRPTTFNDEVEISVHVHEFRGVKLVLSYSMKNVKTNELVFEGKSMHCFVDRDGMPTILRRGFPELDQALREEAAKEAQNGR